MEKHSSQRRVSRRGLFSSVRCSPDCSQGNASMTSPLDKKLKIKGPVLITANRLGDGAVIYRTNDGGWTTQFDGAAVVTTAPAAIELLDAAVADDVGAVGAYVAPVLLDDGGK